MTTSARPAPRRGLSLTQQIFLGLFLGVLAGAYVNWHYALNLHDPAGALRVAGYFKPFSTIFLNLIKMILAPLIFSTLVAGIAGAGHFKVVGRMGLRAILYFEAVTTLALVIGLLAVNILKPGVGAVLGTAKTDMAAAAQSSWDQILIHVFPTSVVDAMAKGDVLQVVVFSIIFALALGMVGEKGKPVIHFCEGVAETMFKFTGIIMYFAPFGVAAAIAYTVGAFGIAQLGNLAKLIGTLYIALAVFYVGVFLPVAWIFKIPIRKFFVAVREPALIAFSTSTSEAALPRAMEVMERLGCSKRVVSFVLPLGYTFNLDGSTLYLSLAAVFIAQAAGVHLSIGQQISMLVTLMLTSKGVAGVPRASLVILAATVASYGLPVEGVATILGVDAVMDMARTMTNVIGNCLATAVVAKWEGEFHEASDRDLSLAASRGEL